MIPIQLIGAAVIASLSFAGAWQIQGMRSEKTLSDLHAQQAMALAQATKEAHERTIQLQKQVDDAERKHQSRLADMRRDLARTRGVADGLRNDLSAASVALPNATFTSVVEYTATLNTVFGECTAEVGRLAEAAAGHSADAVTLLEAWPVQSKH